MTLTIDCDQKFLKMIKELHAAYEKGFTFQFQGDFSGKKEDFKYTFGKVSPEQLYNLIIENGKERKD